MSWKASAGSVYHISLLAMLTSCKASCYFSIELQGEFVMQSTVNPIGSRVQYSHVNITADSIPIWGHCHRRIGNNVILMDSSGGANCIRCFHLRLRSRNVLQVHTEGLEKCYTNEDAALTTCPDEGALDQQGHSKEILLYKTQDFGSRGIHQEYCPINGRFTYIYNVNDGLENNVECPDPVSELDNCPSGSELNLRFRGCSFDSHDITFRCLGDWHGSGNQRYLALLDTRMGDHHPQYRCALYLEEPGTGNIFIAFSSDSTCNSGLVSATVGYETLSLTTLPAAVWPEMVDTSSCRFPSWTQGHWQYLYVEGNTLIYKDHYTFKTYTMRCLGSDSGAGERFLVFGRTQCGEEMYTCMWIKRRGMNVLEFQIGLQSSTYYNSSLCSNTNFQLNQWITQGRMERLQESPCPVAGEYAGYIPDATGLCAKLSSDCKSPEIMYYTVSDCSHNEIYEGSRRHGRKHRQIGTRVFRISDPHTTTSSPSLFSHSTTSLSHLSAGSNQHVTVTNHWTGSQNNLNDSYKTEIYRNYNNNRNPYQISEQKEHSTSGYFLGGNSSPQYPTAYRNLERPYSKSPPQTNDYSDEVYDPWAFSKTHSQRYNQTFTNSTPLYQAPSYSSLFDNIPENSEHNSRGPYSSFSTYNVNSEPSSHNTDYSDKRNFNYAFKHDSSNSDSQFHQRNLNVRGDNIYYGNNERSHGIENGVHRNPYQDIPSSTVFTDPNFSSNIGFNNNNQGIFHVPKISPNTNLQNQPHFMSSSRERVNPNMPSNRNFPRPPYAYDQTQAGGGYYTKSATPIEQTNYYGTPLDATPDQITRNTFRNQMGNPERQFQDSGYPNTVIRQGYDQHDSPGTGRNVHTNQFSSSNHNSDPRNPNIHFPSNNNVNHDISATPSQIQNTRFNHTRLGFSSPQYSQHSLPVHQNRRPATPSPVSRPLSVPFPNISPLSHRSSATPRSTEREEREYRCLGQWEENGRMFTYTQRRDVGSFECFVGSILSDTEIFIKEAGDHCQRDVDPMQHGMKLSRLGPCFGNHPNTARPAKAHPTNSWHNNKHLSSPEPTKPWKPITAPPRGTISGKSKSSHLCFHGSIMVFWTIGTTFIVLGPHWFLIP